MAQGGTYQNATVSIGPAISGALDRAGYEALTYVEIADVGSIPAIGTTSASGNFQTLTADINFKGISQFPNIDLTWARDVTDAGQAAMRAAGLTSFCYPIRVELQDGPPGLTNTVIYIPAQIGNVGLTGGGANDVRQETTTLFRADPELTVNPE